MVKCQSGHLFTCMTPWAMPLHELGHVIACWESMYLHAEKSCTHMIVVIYLHDVMHPHVMLHLFTWQKMHVFTWSVSQLKENRKLTIFQKKWHFHVSAWHWLSCDHIDALTECLSMTRNFICFSRDRSSIGSKNYHFRFSSTRKFCYSIWTV